MPTFQRDNQNRTAIQTRHANCRAESADAEAMTVEAVVSTESAIRMFDFETWSPIQEILLASGRTESEHVVLLDSHNRDSTSDCLGHVENIRTEGSDSVARIHFDDGSEQGKDSFRKYQGQHLRSFSVGYQITQWETVKRGESREIAGRTYTADAAMDLRVVTAHEIKEVSCVCIPADPGANARSLEGIRSSQVTEQQARALLDSKPPADPKPPEPERSDSTTNLADTGNPEGRTMPGTVPADDSATPVDETKIRTDAVTAERERVKQIRSIGADDVTADTVNKAIEDGTNAEEFRTIALAEVRAQRAAGNVPVGADIPNIQTDSDKRRARDINPRSMAIGLAQRLGAKSADKHIARCDYDEFTGEMIFEPAEYRAREEDQKELERDMERAYKLSRMHQCDMASELCRMADIDQPFERRAMVSRAMSTPQASAIYTQATGAVLLEFLGETMDSTQGWLQERDAKNFKGQELVKLEGGKLAHRRRGKKAQTAEFSDIVEKYKVNEFARTLLIDRQDMVDDEIGAWATAVEEFARAIAALRPDLVYSVLLNNGLLSDGKALFDADHKNDLAGALSQGSLQSLLTSISNQQNLSGIPLNLEARHIIVSSELQFKALQLANSGETRGTGQEDGTLNALQSKGLQVHYDARLSTGYTDPLTEKAIAPAADMFFGAVDRGAYGLVYGSLEGTNGLPFINTTMRNSGGIYGLELDVAHVGGCGASDHRGLARSK